MQYAQAGARLADWITEINAVVPGNATARKKAFEYAIAELLDGKTLVQLVEQEALFYPVFRAWVREDAADETVFKETLGERKLIQQERLMAGWWKTAEVAPVDEVTHAVVQKAQDSLAKGVGLFDKGASVSFGASGDGTPKSITVTFVDAAEGKPV